ncbi:MAG TPA: zinc ribbon domain-containing protein [Nitrososphaera sp.]|nr:zinc ribbon domain-containing protein [Nitrososphaera sp.]
MLLKYKANRVVEVWPAYTSVDCSRCGHPVLKSLAVRTHVCTECGDVLDRETTRLLLTTSSSEGCKYYNYRWDAGKLRL